MTGRKQRNGMVMDEAVGGETELWGRGGRYRSTAPMRGGVAGWRARGVSDRAVLSAPLWFTLQGSPGACSVK